ncbi:hypothetical protein RRG08_042795 [Elysia crispata]|uniref:Uncharacterized protein n=1 Tax=Elysia crispata TaxID=231223 RepID=A0AAE0YCB6_9GAST|nr:hypothetical protein RRG08_042795 [Elysia crispata]
MYNSAVPLKHTCCSPSDNNYSSLAIKGYPFCRRVCQGEWSERQILVASSGASDSSLGIPITSLSLSCLSLESSRDLSERTNIRGSGVSREGIYALRRLPAPSL